MLDNRSQLRLMMRSAVSTVLIGLVVACSPLPAPWLPPWAQSATPIEIRNRSALPFCGVDEIELGGLGRTESDSRDCFVAAVRAGRPAEFATIGPTLEGDPIATIVRALPGGGVEILMDTTQDANGPQVWTRTLCQGFSEADDSASAGEGCGEAVVVQ